jgi:hypothetical protein
MQCKYLNAENVAPTSESEATALLGLKVAYVLCSPTNNDDSANFDSSIGTVEAVGPDAFFINGKWIAFDSVLELGIVVNRPETLRELGYSESQIDLCEKYATGKNFPITVVSVSNMGDELITPAASRTEADKLAKSMRVTSNHMVCIDVDGERLYRWDRDRIEGENRWTKTDPDEMETIGPIRMIRRR